MDGAGFLSPAPDSEGARRLFAEDREGMGYVMNLSHLWAHQPESMALLSQLLVGATEAAGLTLRQRGVLVTATASTLGDSYCSLAWGQRLADEADPALAAAVLAGTDDGLSSQEQALARWARQVVRDPSGTSATDVDALRAAGFDDRQVFAITVYVAMRLAFSTVNGALGARPDVELERAADPAVRAAVTWGRPVAEG